ncbi:alpha/beta hydrolase [Ensifer sp. 22564]|uniref:alpha/beta hydrolase n=1 Tax=unclassified Ensifer TaxID=2633371 RepID=UPI003F870F08
MTPHLFRNAKAGAPSWPLLPCVVLSLTLLSACAGRPTGVLEPVAARPSAVQVEMLVTTTRGRAEKPGEMFSGERALSPTFADITVSIPPDTVRKAGEVAWPRKLPPDPATDFATLKAEEIDRAVAEKWLNTHVRKSPDGSVLVFIHGFNNHFEDAVFRFAQIVHDSGARSVPVLATWPSRGSLLAYGYDRESTNYTRNAVERLFQYLARDPEVKEVSILAHSMGNWLALESLRQMAIRNDGLPAKFKNVMLAAPDVDVDVFGSQIADMGKRRPRFTLFVSRDDRALAVSRRVWGNVSRLGAIDPEQSPYKEELAANGITVVDLTKIKAGDNLHHTKFAESPEIVQLIGNRLSGGQTLTDSRLGLGDHIVAATAGAAQTVGTAAGLVVAAPAAIVDQNTRQNYAHHVETLVGPSGGANTADSACGKENQTRSGKCNP